MTQPSPPSSVIRSKNPSVRLSQTSLRLLCLSTLIFSPSLRSSRDRYQRRLFRLCSRNKFSAPPPLLRFFFTSSLQRFSYPSSRSCPHWARFQSSIFGVSLIPRTAKSHSLIHVHHPPPNHHPCTPSSPWSSSALFWNTSPFPSSPYVSLRFLPSQLHGILLRGILPISFYKSNFLSPLSIICFPFLFFSTPYLFSFSTLP